MIKTKIRKIFSVSVLLMLTIGSIFAVLPSNLSNSANINKEDIPAKLVIDPILSVGEDPWWNVSYRWRMCINITNSGSYNLTDNYMSIEFDYANLRDNYDMDPDLFDVRIVENYVVRNYYVKKDFPANDLATVWFETNATIGVSEYDTYIYWGNASINYRGSNHVNYDPSGTSWWSFEEGSGNYGSTTVDSLNFANATLWGSSSSFSPDYDSDAAVGSYSLNFNGGNDFLYINDEMHFTNANEIPAVTVSCWFKTSQTGGSYSDNWAFFDFDRSEYFNFYIRPDDGRIGFSSAATGYSGQNDFYGSTTGLNDGEWHFAAIVYDGSDKIIYIDDGVEDARWVNAMNGLAFGRTADRWGFIGDGSEASSENGARNNIYYNGNIDEVRYFDYAVAPDEIQWLANYHPITTDLLPITERAASVTIIVEDVDGRRVPGAEVSLWKNLTHILEVGSTTYTDFTGTDGTVSFTKVPFGFYNISVNYTLFSGLYEEVVYDSRSGPAGEVEFKGLIVSTTVQADLWTIDFEVDDWDSDPLDYGYIEVSAGTSEVLETLVLDSAGNTTFRWLNRTSYNYTVYYDNVDYTIQNPTPLNSSTINRTGPMIYYEYIKVDMSTLEIIVLDNTETVLVEGATVRLTVNGTNNIVTELKTDETGTAYGLTNTELLFWYQRGWTYNISLWIVNTQFNFKLNYSDQFFNPGAPPQSEYNYTLNSASTLIFEIALNFQDYITRLQNTTVAGGDSVPWGQTMNIYVNFSTSDNGLAGPWIGDDGTNSIVTCSIKSTGIGNPTLYQDTMTPLGNGNYSVDVDSSLFTAGDYGKSYLIVISGEKAAYKTADDLASIFTIIPIPTGMTMHNYTTLAEITSNEVSQHYNELINVTLRYYDATTDNPLVADTFTYDWDYGSGAVNPDPMNPGYYTIEIDTSAATNVGKYLIEVTAGRENYSKIDDFGFFINILTRPTQINGSTGILYVSEDIYIFESITFTFNYLDALSATPISNLDEMSYLLQELDESGDPILGTTEAGDLIPSMGLFILDLDTETREDGEFSIIVTLDKMNYDHRIAIISLTIKKRVFDFKLPDEFTASKIEIGSGAPLEFTLNLTDPNNNSVVVIGASVELTFQGTPHAFTDNGDGTYTLNIPKIADAFFSPQTFTATLNISKQYFSTQESSITIVVKMHETFGFPTFYLLMIVGAAVAVIASLTIYRTVQQARIPTFVKKARKMKKEIKGKKSISDSLLYPTKEEYMVKKLGDNWEKLGLSLKTLLGVEDKKKKKQSEIPTEFKITKGGEA
ncbi:MAG: LamG-like jellyroll fold domain-containing protein [Promethearchaeota archaeon]